MNASIVMVSSYPPRLCGIATFCEEAREFVTRDNPEREVLVVSHMDGWGGPCWRRAPCAIRTTSRTTRRG
jgi:hypothetical protein